MEQINSTNGGADQVLVEGHSHAKKVVFNRPKQLNALSFQMVSRLLELFLACEGDHNVKLIILKGKGRAFCAGGDVAAVVNDITEGNWKLGAEFFRIEYIMNYVMATYSKPQVSILNGIVMGGGAGASIHGRFRVATENSVFAMPETALGLFPDVGATYFLPRLPGFFGEYVGLTGTRLDGAEMLACGLATHFVPEVRLSLLEESLCNANSSDPAIISAIIDEFSQQPRLKEKSVYHLLDIINDFFSRRTVEEIILALEREAVNTNNGWISSTIKSLKAASPTSLKITLRSIREGRHQGVGQCLISEYRMVCHVMQGKVSKDFMEVKMSTYYVSGWSGLVWTYRGKTKMMIRKPPKKCICVARDLGSSPSSAGSSGFLSSCPFLHSERTAKTWPGLPSKALWREDENVQRAKQKTRVYSV